jgi:hypothetical protein
VSWVDHAPTELLSTITLPFDEDEESVLIYWTFVSFALYIRSAHMP